MMSKFQKLVLAILVIQSVIICAGIYAIVDQLKEVDSSLSYINSDTNRMTNILRDVTGK